MHCFRAGLLAGLDDFLDREIALRRRRRADRHRLVRLAHMQRVGVRLGVDRHGLDAHGPRRPDDPAGDLPAIGDQDLLEHRHSGMLSCFFHGFSSFLSRSIASERQIRLRVECGRITSSMKPRAPATNGLANFWRYSSVRSAIFCLSPISARKMISTAPFGPMTAISAEGQAKLTSPRMCLELMTS